MGAASLNGLDTEQVRKAAKALLTYSAKKSEESNNLLQDDELLYLVRCTRACSLRDSLLEGHWVQALPTYPGPLGRSPGEASFPPRTPTLASQNIALKKIPQKPRNDKPVRLPVPHALYSLEDAEACLFVKDHKGERGGHAPGCPWSHRWRVGGSWPCQAHAHAPVPHPPRAGEGHKASKKKVKEESIPGISKVIGLSKLR